MAEASLISFISIVVIFIWVGVRSISIHVSVLFDDMLHSGTYDGIEGPTMALTPLLPPLPTLTLSSNQLNAPPEKPPDPSISMLFPEKTQYHVPDNPFRGSLPKMRNKEHKEALQDALSSIRAPFLFNIKEPLQFNGECVGTDASTDDFNTAVNMVTAAIERGYYAARDPTPLGPSEWVSLSCALLAAVGRGYHRQYSTEKESTLEKVRAEVIDLDPLPKNPTMFHCLASIADDINTHIGTDQEDYQDWYLTLKKDFNTKVTKAAAAEVDEKWLEWKAKHIDMLAQQNEQDISAQARNRGIDYFIATGERLGLCITRSTPDRNSTPTPTAGRKRMASGSLPGQRLPTPVMRQTPTTKTWDASASTPRGRDATLQMPIRMETDPSSSPKKTAPAPVQKRDGNTDLANIMAAINTALGPAIQSAMAPYAAKLTALEKVIRPAQESNEMPNFPASTGLDASTWAPTNMVQRSTGEKGKSTLVSHNEWNRRTKSKANANARNLEQELPTNPKPASYAGAATAAANTKQPPAPLRLAAYAPTITEVTVIRAGGFHDSDLEQKVRARATDAIVREVAQKMAKVVARPIPLRAGRWSIHPRSRGNFVYSFDSNIPFDLIATYEHILLSPF